MESYVDEELWIWAMLLLIRWLMPGATHNFFVVIFYNIFSEQLILATRCARDSWGKIQLPGRCVCVESCHNAKAANKTF